MLSNYDFFLQVSELKKNQQTQSEGLDLPLVILLMIPNGQGCHYLAVKKLSSILRETTSKKNGEIYSFNLFLELSSFF